MTVLTQDSLPVIGQVAWVLGKIMEGIFTVIDFIGIPNIGLAIILFTIVVNLLMLPLTIKQQKFSKLSAKMNPEIQAVQAKYKGKKDNESMMAQNQEVQAVYAKYGVSPSGSCVQLLIQMPILISLYSVIRNVPAYVGKVREAFFPLVSNLMDTVGGAELVQGFKNSAVYAGKFTSEKFLAGDTGFIQNIFIDCLNKASTADFYSISEKFPSLASDVENTLGTLSRYNNFLGLNIGNSPQYIIMEAYKTGAWLLIAGAVAIPLLSAVTQWINAKLMPQQATDKNNEQGGTMASTMKTMNMIMPVMSAWFCFSLPSGMGLYWIAGSVVRSVQQILVNKHIDKMDFDGIIQKNSAKSAKKLEKIKEQQKRLNRYANVNARNISNKNNSIQSRVNSVSATQKNTQNTLTDGAEKSSRKVQESSRGADMKQGSIMAKANMVRQYNERNNKGEKEHK
jgi:YidC/Oxa1 family membrane protein insertase